MNGSVFVVSRRLNASSVRVLYLVSFSRILLTDTVPVSVKSPRGSGVAFHQEDGVREGDILGARS